MGHANGAAPAKPSLPPVQDRQLLWAAEQPSPAAFIVTLILPNKAHLALNLMSNCGIISAPVLVGI